MSLVKQISREESWKLFNNQEAVLVDVRTSREYRDGNVPKSLLVQWKTEPGLVKNPRFLNELEKKIDKNKKILLLCRSGRRSQEAAEYLINKGYKEVYNIIGGVLGDTIDGQEDNAWQQEGLSWNE